MEKIGKVWGHTELIVAQPTFEMHRIEVDEGGYCSVHLHQDKVNLFCVEHGALQIEVWKADYKLWDRTFLYPGERTQVAAGEYHRFVATEKTTCFEVYWPTRWAKIENDIKRICAGGLLDSAGRLDELPVPTIPTI